MLRSSIFVLAAAVAALVAFVSGAAGGPAAPTAFPVTITTASGKVTIQRKPVRIVSLSPTATESLFAIGAGPQVVAVDDQSDYPKNAPKTTLSGFTPNVEAIAAYRPDLVVASYDPKGLVSALGRLGIPVILHGTASNFRGAYQQIRQLGMVTGREPAATRLIARMKASINRIVKASRSRADGLSVYHEISPDFYSASTKSFVGKVYAALGLENIADEADSAGTGFPQLSAEYIVCVQPRPDRPRGHGVLRAEAVDRGGATRLGPHQRRPHGLDRPHRRLDRIALGAAARELLPRDVLGARALVEP